MPICPRCKMVLEEDVRFCPVDGTPIAPQQGESPAPAASLPTAAAVPRPTAAATPGPAAALEGAEPALIGALIDNRYRILSPLGEGGIGAVYLAEHAQIRRKVAVKVLHPEMAVNPEFQARFEREALAASKVTHPSCVQVLDYGTFAGRAYLVMELAQGKDLRDQLREGPIPLSEAVAIADQILSALGQIHSHGIVHRDLKPANLMICEPDQAGVQVKLLDFGLAKNLQPGEPGGSPLTQYGTVFGTPGYISPEQATATPADARSDIYSMGVILFEMVCGRTPFVSDDPIELIQAHISLPPPNARRLRKEVSPQLEAVINRALQKARKERYQTAEEFAEALAQVPEARASSAQALPAEAAAAAASGADSPSGVALRQHGRTLLGRPKLVLSLLGVLGLIAALLALLVFTDSPPAADQKSAPTVEVDEQPSTKPEAGERVRRRSAPTAKQQLATKRRADPAADKPPPETAPPVSAGVRRAANYLGRGWTEAAIKQAQRVLKKNRKDAQARLILGHAYYKKLWCSDAIKEYNRALSLAPQLKSNRTLISHSIGCLGRRSTSGKASHLLVHKVGAPAKPLLQEAARDHGSTDIRRRAAQLLEQLADQGG